MAIVGDNYNLIPEEIRDQQTWQIGDRFLHRERSRAHQKHFLSQVQSLSFGGFRLKRSQV